ncbi:MAG TPA: erythromycin esterase family protein [Gemmataceae bacterium]|nr:erythromycin esterase family protein [Gemmataceae bacterium]
MNKTGRLAPARSEEIRELIAQVRKLALPLRTPDDLDPLMNRIADARYVLLGEASHGTAEYYLWRTRITQRLIREKGFSFLAVEGDWPDCYQVNRYVKGLADAGERAGDVLHTFERWPTWMWANEEVVPLAEWLREYNDAVAQEKKVGFYGLDVYSLWESLYAILSYLQRANSSALPAAWRALRCFEPYGEDVQRYARATMLVPTSCEEEVVALLGDLRRKVQQHHAEDRDGYFEAEQNALVTKNAESYYRAMVRGGPDSWNIRDRHMTETLERLMRHHGPNAKAIVWEHNTHIGDARFTDMAEDDMVNIGQLVRESHEREDVVLVGFGGYRGSVIAGQQWDAPMETMTVPAARPGSWEDILHQAGPANKLLLFSEASRTAPLMEPRGHRAIGVVYHPKYEHLGNYVPTVLPRRYDAFLYFDQTEALHPLPIVPRIEQEMPETYPSGV